MPKLDDTQLRAIVAAEKSQALSSFSTSDLSKQRARAMDYYLSDMSSDMPNAVGRSAAVSSDVADTVESIMPALMEIFAAGDEVVRFNPVGPEDEEQAAQETDYVNHVFYQDNPGFLIFATMFKDALLQKTGIVKFWWEVSEKKERETYEGQSTETFEYISEQDGVEVIEHTEYPAPPGPAPLGVLPPPGGPAGGAVLPGGLSPSGQGTAPPYMTPQAQQLQPPSAVMNSPPNGVPLMAYGQPNPAAMPPPVPVMLHDFVIERTTKQGRAKVEPVPPEEFLLARRARDIANAPYLAHRVRKSQSELIEQGYDRDEVEDLPTSAGEWQDTEEAISRSKGLRTTDASVADIGDSTGAGDANSSMRLIDVIEHYIMIDYDGDGVAELRKVTTAGGSDVLLKRKGQKEAAEPFDAMPFAVISPILLPHRVIGVSIADLVIDIQKIKTALFRGILDNAYNINSPRTEIAETHAGVDTIDDLLTVRPGGLIRTKMPGGLTPFVTPPIGQSIFPVLQYIDQVRTERTGTSPQQPGPDTNALANQTATAANIASTAAQQRIKLIARIFAETGVKDLFLGLHRLILEHGRDEKARVLRLRNKWVTVDPSDWRGRNDMTVTVGLGTGNKDQMLMHLQNILGQQYAAVKEQGGTQGPLVTLGNIYKTLSEICKNAGFRNPEDFWTDPTPQPGQPPIQPSPPPPDPKMIEVQGKLKLMEAQQNFDQQHQAMVAQSDQQHQAMKTAAEHQREVDKAAAERASADARAEADLRTKMQMAEIESANTLKIERIKSATAIEVAEINGKLGIEEGVRKAVITALAGAHAAAATPGPDGEPGKPPPISDLADHIARAMPSAMTPPPEPPAPPPAKVSSFTFHRDPVTNRLVGATKVDQPAPPMTADTPTMGTG